MERRKATKKTRNRFRWKGRGFSRRILCFLLCMAMFLQAGAGISFAASKKKISFTMLESSRIGEGLPEGDLIYFGTAEAAVEEHGEYAIRIFREGNLNKKASVSIHTVDMTALYGEDYEIVSETVEGLTETGNGKTLLEEYAKGGKAVEDGSLGSLSMELESKETNSASNNKALEAAHILEGSDKETGGNTSSLAAEKEKQSGEKARTTEETERSSMVDALSDALVTESMKNLKASSKCRVTFQEGEDEKIVRFRILEDGKSEGTEGFSLLLTEPEGAEIYEVSTAGITVQDDEKQVRSKVSFTKLKYSAENGKAALTVKRTGAEYSVCDMTVLTSGDTAKAGENYTELNQSLAFAPYETEKEITFDVAGEGTFYVLLTELKACTKGKYTKASVEIKEGNQKEASGGLEAKAGKSVSGAKKAAEKTSAKADVLKQASSDSETKSFPITINKKEYAVEYKMNEATGKILDDSYSPAVEVGKYYFSADKKHGGIFEYGSVGGDSPSWLGNRRSEYVFDEKQKDRMDVHYGKAEYCSPTIWHEGWAEINTKEKIPGLYYQYFTPDWESTSSSGGGQKFRFKMEGSETAEEYTGGKYGRTCDKGHIKNTSNEELLASVRAIDDSSLAPKSYMRFYGVCAMYKKYNIKVQNASAKKYRTGEAGSYIEMAPVNMSVRCGAQPSLLSGSSDSRDVYANTSDEDTNLVFSVGDMSLNNHSGKFGYINGYKIVIDPGKKEDRAEVSYPEDFKYWLQKSEGKTDNTGLVFSSSAIDGEIKKVEQDLGIIPYDKYFIAWIDSVQKAVADTVYGYQQNLVFTPRMEYYDVEVEVLEAKGISTDQVHFKDAQLSKTGKYKFHAGDSIEAEVVTEDADSYNVVGYEVSDNAGITYNTITDGSDLFLEYNKSYKIRPVVTTKSNAVEVRFEKDSGAEDKIELQGLIPKDELKGTEFEGKNILDLNPQEKTVQKRAEPVKGKEYVVRLALKKAEEGEYVYRPSVKLKTQNTKYVAQYFPLIAAASASDNVVEVGLSKVKKSSLKKYQVKGCVTSAFTPIRSTGLEVKKLPVAGYVVSAGKGTQNTDKKGNIQIDSLSSTTGELGEYYLNTIVGVEGDRIPLLLSNGVVNGTAAEVVLSNGIKASDGEAYQVNAGNIEITYPYGAPKVTSIDYTYENSANQQKQGGNTDNSVHIYDDTITITAKVNPYGRKIKEAVFTVYRFGSGDGQYSAFDEYRVREAEDNPNTFRCEIPKMTENLHNGDRIKVRLVDSMEQTLEVGQYDEDGKPILDDEGNLVVGQSFAIEYPDVDTGLRFYTENELQSPQTYDLENCPAADVPLLGSSLGSTSSGLLTFGKIKWADNTGYTLQVGVNALISTIPGMNTSQKDAALKNFSSSVKEAAEYNSTKRSIPKNAEEVILNLAGKETEQTDLSKEKETMQGVLDEIRSDAKSGAKKAVAGMNKSPTWSVNAALLLAFDFVFNPVTEEYVFCSGAVSIGGSYTFNKTQYVVIECVPAFLNFTATLQADILISYPTESGKNAMTAGEFNSYAGNLTQKLASPTSRMNLMFSGKVQLGVGMCGVLSARGYVTLKLQFDVPIYEAGSGGVLIGASGGIGFDLLVMSINVDVGNVFYGVGSLKNKTGYDFFGSLASKIFKGQEKTGKDGKKAFSREKDTILKKNGKKEQILLHPYTAGTSDMESFGKGSRLKKASPSLASVTALLDNAAERTRPKIIPLGQGKKMIVFIANREGSDGRNFVLDYSVYNGSSWSKPEPVAEDGTVDSTPAVLKAGDKVVIAWADASRAFTEKDSTIEQLSAMGISAAVYDIGSGKMGKEVTLAEDKYMNLSPQLNIDGTKIYCSYMKRDVAGAKEEDLLDMKKIYSAMAYRSYDYVSGEKKEERFVSIKHDTITDPVIMDYSSVITEAGGDSYLVSTYTVDEDDDFNTNADRELFLSIYNLDKGREYYPICISNDSVSQSVPKLTNLDGKIYLTWLDDGYMFNLADVSDLLEAFFDESAKEEMKVDKSKFINGYMDGKNENRNWYKKDAKELGMGQEEYEDSFYADIVSGSFRKDSVNFSQKEEIMSNISSYVLTTDGDDIYIFFTDFGSDQDSSGVEIYGMKYKRMEEDAESKDEDWGFSGKAVQITQENKVIDELDLYMDKGGRVTAASNYFSQWIDESGSIQYGANQLVEMEFETKNSLKVQNDHILFSERLAAGETENLSFVVENAGLLEAKGFDYRVSSISGSTETLIESGHKDVLLDSGETTEVSVLWEIPKTLSDTSIKVEVLETGIEDNKPYQATEYVPYESDVKFISAQVLWDEKGPYLMAEVSNAGNASSKAYAGKLYALNGDGDVRETCAEFTVPALQSGEGRKIEIPFSLKPGDFSSLGVLDLKLCAEDGDELVSRMYTRFASSVPVCAALNGGKGVKIAKGSKVQVKAEAAPWNGIAGEAVFYSDNPSIAAIDSKGNVTGIGAGKTNLHVYYPSAGVSASVSAEVTGGTEKEGSIMPDKTSVVIAPGKSANIKFKTTVKDSSGKTASVKASVSDKKVVSKVSVSGNKVKITAAKKAARGASATVTLKASSASGKAVSAKIKVTAENRTTKIIPPKKSLSLKKGKTAKLTLKVYAQNNKKPATDLIKIKSKQVALTGYTVKKGKIVLKLKGKKKGTEKITVQSGKKKVKVKVVVK
ncbi:hypothetical protein D7V86_04965 [bacterium D16-51]|nr:hypothetical protein D7V96_20960 [bacterium D16-59]RKI61627.1 hypothetical protein D7V86_04965 [bacterium D16-51]